ncbi:MAG: sulfatase [Spirochaetota bacterium]
MRAILLLFDSLNKRYLPPYGAKDVLAPNFSRLAEKTVCFDRAYVGSMPCMPARRELHTGRYNFLHRSWGPIEPFDDSMPELLKDNGVYTHLTTDHQHYWEDGGATYHQRYSSFEFQRGQEGDPWKGHVEETDVLDGIGRHLSSAAVRQDSVNRSYIPVHDETVFPQYRTVSTGLEFLQRNQDADNWLLQIETFDPHEPFYAPQKYRDLYPEDYDGPRFDWPNYGRVNESDQEVEHCRREYRALVSFCDAQLGRVLDTMDELNLWDDTMLIVTTDHGFFLGERQWWAKIVQPFYNEVAEIPFFVWDPRHRITGERRRSMTQWIDIAPTLYDYFNVPIPQDVQGRSRTPVIAADEEDTRDVLFGQHGRHINLTDGRYVYMRAPLDRYRTQPTADEYGPFNYTLMPTHMRSLFSVEELEHATLSKPFSFTKGLSLLRVPAPTSGLADEYETMLFDLQSDPGQTAPIHDETLEAEMVQRLKTALQRSDAPEEIYERYGLK